MTKTIYLVKGRTGEWDDSYAWVAKAFLKQEKATSFCETLNTIADKSHAKHFGSDSSTRDEKKMYRTQEKVRVELLKLDPQASVSFPGTSYKVEELIVDMEE